MSYTIKPASVKITIPVWYMESIRELSPDVIIAKAQKKNYSYSVLNVGGVVFVFFPKKKHAKKIRHSFHKDRNHITIKQDTLYLDAIIKGGK